MVPRSWSEIPIGDVCGDGKGQTVIGSLAMNTGWGGSPRKHTPEIDPLARGQRGQEHWEMGGAAPPIRLGWGMGMGGGRGPEPGECLGGGGGRRYHRRPTNPEGKSHLRPEFVILPFVP